MAYIPDEWYLPPEQVWERQKNAALTARPNYGEAPFEATRLSTGQRLLAALSGLSAVRPGAGFGGSFLQGLGGSARNVFLAQNQARQAAQEYAQRQMEQEAAAQDREIRKGFLEAQRRQGLVQIMGPDGTPIYVTQADAVGKSPYLEPKPPKEPKREPLVAVQGPSGPVLVRESQAVCRAPAKTGAEAGNKPPTEGQANAAAYYDRASASDQAISSFEASYPTMGWRQLQAKYSPNVSKTPEQQAYIQAKREFITAKLRRESGAAISQSEFENEDRTLFAQPGDNAKVIAQKAAARRRVIEGLRRSGGSAVSSGTGAATLRWNPATEELEPIR